MSGVDYQAGQAGPGVDGVEVRAARLLVTAASLIETCGLWQGGYWPGTPSEPGRAALPEDVEAERRYRRGYYVPGDPLDVLGALAVADGKGDSGDSAVWVSHARTLAVVTAHELVRQRTHGQGADGEGLSLAQFNDSAGRSSDEVGALLRSAATRLDPAAAGLAGEAPGEGRSWWTRARRASAAGRDVAVLHRYRWWPPLRGSLALRVHVACRVCGAEQYGPTRRRATRTLLAYHTPGDPRCLSWAAELQRDGYLQAQAIEQAEAQRRAELDQAARIAELTAHVLVWWRDCTCAGDHCGYGDGECPMCQLLEGTGLACPRDELYGAIYPGLTQWGGA